MKQLLCCMLLLIAPWCTAAEESPLVEVEFKNSEAIPGQPLSLHITVLVPTWLTSPVEFPNLDGPNLVVRLPEGATHPVSRRIGTQTWSGVTRHYRLIPMLPGEYKVPEQELVVTWADPQTNQPRRDTRTTEPLDFRGVVPPDAARLDPFFAAEKLELTQDVEGSKTPLEPGQSITRTVTAKIVGTLPLFLPPLLPTEEIPGVARYPGEPILEEKAQRGQFVGTRTEQVTYVAQGGGGGSAKPIAFDWYNLTTGRVETARLEGLDLSVKGIPFTKVLLQNPRRLAPYAAFALLAVAALWFLLWILGPRLRTLWQARRARYRASERYAWNRLRRAVRTRDYGTLFEALDAWAGRVAGDPLATPALSEVLLALGAARYGTVPGKEARAWRRLDRVLQQIRSNVSTAPSTEPLPPLNPTRGPGAVPLRGTQG